MNTIPCLIFLIGFTTTNTVARTPKDYGMQIIHMSANNNNNKPRTIYVDQQEKTVFLACEIKRRNTELQWFHNNSQITTNPPYVLTWNKKSAREQGSVLMIRPLRGGRASDGKYDCVAYVGSKTITATVNIIVRERHLLPSGFPEIKVQPTNVHTKRDSVDFNCCVAGTPPFRFKWYFNRNPIEADGGLHEVSQNVRKGEMFCSNLKVTNASFSKGFYQCVVMSDIGQVVSKGAKIAFHEERRFRRSIEVVEKVLCRRKKNPAEGNSTLLPGQVNTNTISRKCSSPSEMIITWSQPENIERASGYFLMIRNKKYDSWNIPGQCFKVSKKGVVPAFKFTNIGAGEEYEVGVDTIPSAYPNDEGLPLESISPCPYEGTWGAWSKFSECECKNKCQDYCIGRKWRTRSCKGNGNIVLDNENCDWSHKTGASSSKRCYCSGKETTRKPSKSSGYQNKSAPVLKREKLQTNTDGTSSRKSNIAEYRWIIVAGVCLLALVPVVFLFVWWKKKYHYRRSFYNETCEMTEATTVYISYFADTEKKEEKMLNLAAGLYQFGIKCKVDLLCQVDINNNGGLPIWLPENIMNSDKILVVLTKEYVEAIHCENVEVPDNVCKVHSEFKLINNLMYHSCQRTPKIVLLVDEDVKYDLIPPVFRDMFHCTYPKGNNEKDEAFNTLLGMLLDTEPIQVLKSA